VSERPLRPQSELKLVGVPQRERFDPARAERGGELPREAVRGEHAFRLHEFDEAQQAWEIRVVRQRKGRVQRIR